MTEHVSHTRSRSELLVFERTDVGRVRDHNEDSKYTDPKGRYFIVADGMGGHAAGEVASHLAVEEVKKALSSETKVLDAIPDSRTRPIMTELLTRVGELANRAVRKHANEDKATQGMGTTLDVACVTGDGVWVAHVGDSRTYLVRGNSVTQLTTDHTVAQKLLKDEGVNREEVMAQWGSVLVEAIGVRDHVNVDVVHSALESGDRLLLCSDGLYEYFPRAEEIAEVLAMEGSKAGLERLVDLAFDRGGKDNITGVLVEIVDAPKSMGSPSREDSEYFGHQATRPGPSDIEYTGDVVDQDYGIAEAIMLMRKLPDENPELVVRVVAQTLKSTNIAVTPIIRDAASKQAHIEDQVHLLRTEIAERKAEVACRLKEISNLDTDREETTMVMERLKLAEKLAK